MTTNRNARFRITNQVPELKKSLMLERMITGAVCRLSSQRQTQAPRTQRAGAARSRGLSGARRRGPSLEVREQVEGAGHDHRVAELVRARERGRWIRHGLDLGEAAAGRS